MTDLRKRNAKIRKLNFRRLSDSAGKAKNASGPGSTPQKPLSANQVPPAWVKEILASEDRELSRLVQMHFLLLEIREHLDNDELRNEEELNA